MITSAMIKVRRHPQWPRRLHQLISTSQDVTFAWGTYDCWHFVARAIREMTGIDVAAAVRAKYGTYSDEAGAQKLFLQGQHSARPGVPTDALGNFAAQIATENNFPEVNPVTLARRGDVVWVDNRTQFGALGIVDLTGRHAVCMSSKGTVQVHMQRFRRAWRVG
jgi:hypothetical protein